jgi:hypothetical protein
VANRITTIAALRAFRTLSTVPEPNLDVDLSCWRQATRAAVDGTGGRESVRREKEQGHHS